MSLRVAAYCIIVDDRKILLSHWRENGSDGWTLPGGGLEALEDPKDAAVREVLEETGYHAELEELLGIDSHIVPVERRFEGDEPLHALRIVYRAHITGGELTNEVDGSTDEARWVPLNEVRALRRVGLVEAGMRLAGVWR